MKAETISEKLEAAKYRAHAYAELEAAMQARADAEIDLVLASRAVWSAPMYGYTGKVLAALELRRTAATRRYQRVCRRLCDAIRVAKDAGVPADV